MRGCWQGYRLRPRGVDQGHGGGRLITYICIIFDKMGCNKSICTSLIFLQEGLYLLLTLEFS